MPTIEDYRKFLAAVRKQTGIEALEPESETVLYNYFFDLDRAAEDVEEFIATLEKILQLCDLWAERVKGALPAAGASAPAASPPLGILA